MFFIINGKWYIYYLLKKSDWLWILLMICLDYGGIVLWLFFTNYNHLQQLIKEEAHDGFILKLEL